RQGALILLSEGFSIAPPAAADRSHDLEPLRACVLEQGRLGGRFDDRADVGQRDRLGMHLDFANPDQMIDEPPEAKSIEVIARSHLVLLIRSVSCAHAAFRLTIIRPVLSVTNKFQRAKISLGIRRAKTS